MIYLIGRPFGSSPKGRLCAAFSDALATDLTTRSVGRRPRRAKARVAGGGASMVRRTPYGGATTLGGAPVLLEREIR
jgi:hypothetical protein